jgi:hypothetical protein
MLLSSTPKFEAALQFPLSSTHRIASRLNFAVYYSLLDFLRPSSITRVKKKKKRKSSLFTGIPSVEITV